MVGDDVYGGTYRVFQRFFTGWEFVPPLQIQVIRNKSRMPFVPKQGRFIWKHPVILCLKVSDIKAIAQLAKEKGLLLIVDNTFLTPYWQNPLDLGADIVLHSATKYLGGHSDVVAGLVVVKEKGLGEKLHYLQNAMGRNCGPQRFMVTDRG